MASPSTPPVSNVVALPPSADAWPSAVQLVWRPLQTALTVACDRWAQEADDALFKRSEQGGDANEFFDGLRLLRLNRANLEKDFWRRLRQGVDQWLNEASRPVRLPGAPVTLSLVENDELEESLAVNAMADRADREGAPQWDALRQRLQHALQLSRPDTPLPFAPLAIAAAFRQSLDQTEEWSVPVRLVLLKLFERHAWGPLAEGIAAANEQMRQSGILPHLTPAVPQVPRRATSSPAPAAPQEERSTVQDFLEQVPHRTAVATQAMPSEATLLQALARLRPWLNQWNAEHAAQGAPVARSHDTPVSEALMGALARDADLLSSMAALPPVPPPVLREALLAQLPPESRQKEHEQAIDMVAIVFDFLLKDNALPVKVQALLGRLQLPYLRVAVLDPHGFAQAHHPARQLLDTLTKAGQSWSEADDTQGTQYAALHDTVERLLAAPDEDMDIFVREHDTWQNRVTREGQRQQQFEQRAVQAQEGQERRQTAQREVAKALTDRLQGAALPPMVRGLMTQHWGPALTLMWLRHGPQSTEYRRSVFLLDQLRFVAQASPTSPGVDRVVRMSEGMAPLLRQGWGLLGMDEATLNKMVHTVMTFVAERLGTPSPAMPSDAERIVLAPVVETPVAPTPEPVVIVPAPVLAPAPAAERETVSHLQAGTWLEFEHEGTVHRGKLSWISPFSGRWLMVSPKGLKVADLDPQDVARQLADGRAQVLPDQSLVQRALATQPTATDEPAPPAPPSRRHSP